MNHTAERNMRTGGETVVTTMIHANLPKRAWGFATLHATDTETPQCRVWRIKHGISSRKMERCAPSGSNQRLISIGMMMKMIASMLCPAISKLGAGSSFGVQRMGTAVVHASNSKGTPSSKFCRMSGVPAISFQTPRSNKAIQF